MNARTVAAMLFAGVLAGCASDPRTRVSDDTASRAAEVARSMVGTSYRYGGNSPAQGFDCSGLVQYSYGRAGVKLPRSTSELRRVSAEVSTQRLRRGDLLFFNQERKASHVAIYLGNDQFVHAPSSGKKVYVARLSDNYWRRHLHDARRVDTR